MQSFVLNDTPRFTRHGLPFRVWGPIVFLAMATFSCYANSLRNGFVADDHFIIVSNHETLSYKTALTAFFSGDRLFNSDQLPYYRPITRLSFFVDKYFFGVNARGFHAVNIALHVACTILIFFTMLRLGHRQSVSFFTALLFGIHPINSETVNFIASRNNILATMFVLMSLLAFLRAEKNGGVRGYFLSAIFFFMALLSKETGAMLFPFLIILKVYNELRIRKERNPLRWDMSYIYYHVLFLAAYLFLRYIAVDGNYVQDHVSGLGSRLKQLFYITPSYFSLLVAPVKITWPHYVPNSFNGQIYHLILWWSALLITFFYFWYTNNKNTRLWLGWTALNSIPISNIIPFSNLPMAERYLYLPAIGFFILGVEALFSAAERSNVKRLHIVGLTCCILAFGIRTFYRNLDWNNDLSLSQSAVKADPKSARNHFFLGLELYLDGKNRESREEFEKSLALDSSFDCASWAHYYLGAINMQMNHTNDSKRCFTSSVQLGNGAAKYIMSLFFSKERDAGRNREQGKAILPITMNAIPSIPEARERMLRLADRNPRIDHIQHLLTSFKSTSKSEKWKLIQRYSTGTEFFYAPAEVQKKGNDVIIVTKEILAPPDKLAFAMRIIKLPLVHAAETYFVFKVNCPQKVYTTTYMEFRDRKGGILGQIYPEEEEYIMSEYLFPGTAMRSLSDRICLEQFP